MNASAMMFLDLFKAVTLKVLMLQFLLIQPFC